MYLNTLMFVGLLSCNHDLDFHLNGFMHAGHNRNTRYINPYKVSHFGQTLRDVTWNFTWRVHKRGEFGYWKDILR